MTARRPGSHGRAEKENAMIENPETAPNLQTPPPPPPPKNNTWKKVAIGCGIALILFICCAAVGVTVYLMRDSIPGLDSLFSGGSSNTNGDLIAFTSYRNGKGDIYVINIDGTGETQLTTSPANDTDAEWSPDGSRIAFVSERDGNNEIYIMNADGSGVTRLTDNTADDASPTFSPDGQLLAFLSKRSGNYEIHVMNVDGSNVRTVTNSPNTADLDPTWSPDGQQLIYASGTGLVINLWRINLDGTGSTQLTYNTKDAFISWFPSWCWATGLVAYETNSYGAEFADFDIVTMNPDGTNQTRLTFTDTNDSFPEWSPDGTMLAFVSNRDGNFELYIMNADGSNIRRLTNNTEDDGAPSWQPAPR
jgi:Tol biopolymer transport system component